LFVTTFNADTNADNVCGLLMRKPENSEVRKKDTGKIFYWWGSMGTLLTP